MSATGQAARASLTPQAAQVTMVEPLLGIAGPAAFTLTPVEGAMGLHVFASEAVRLFVIEPEAYLDDYAPRWSDEQRRAVGIDDDDEPTVLVIVTPHESGPTANLLAPIAVGPSGLAQQFVLGDQGFRVRVPLEGAQRPV